MSIEKFNGRPNSPEKANIRRRKFGALLSEPSIHEDEQKHNYHQRISIDASSFIPSSPSSYSKISDINMTNYSNPSSASSSPYNLMASPWTQPSPYSKSPWIHQPPDFSYPDYGSDPRQGLIGSLVRKEGHIYSLAASGDLLYTGSDSKNVRVWKGLEDIAGFKSSSGLVKAIVVYKDRVFTGHQDGRIRVWKCSGIIKKSYRRVGSLPTTRDLLMKSINPRNYVQVRRHRNVPWIKHFDAVSCMSIDMDQGLLYSGSWDKTLKVWRVSDSKCLESIQAHDDAVNSVVTGFDGFIFTCSADGSVKAWRRELVGKYTQHVLVETLLNQEHALTSLAVCHEAGAVYAGSSDGLVSFWEREKHFMSYGGVLRGHKLAVLCLAAGGNLVLSGSADKSICVWRRDTGGVHVCAAVLTGHSGPVKCIAMEKDMVVEAGVEEEEEEEEGNDKRWTVYSGSLDKSVKVWRVSGNGPRLKELQVE